MSLGGASIPKLTPLPPPTPVVNTPLTAYLQAAGRRAGLRAAVLSQTTRQKPLNKATKLSGE